MYVRVDQAGHNVWAVHIDDDNVIAGPGIVNLSQPNWPM